MLSFVLLYLGRLVFKYVGAVVLDLRKLGMICASFPVAKYQSFIVGLDSVRAFGRVNIFAEVRGCHRSRWVSAANQDEDH